MGRRAGAALIPVQGAGNKILQKNGNRFMQTNDCMDCVSVVVPYRRCACSRSDTAVSGSRI